VSDELLVVSSAIRAASTHNSQLRTALQGEEGDFGGAVEADGDADGADATVDVELHAVEAVEAFDVFFCAERSEDGAEDGHADLASVGVAGEHEVDQAATGMGYDGVGEVGAVGHEQDGAVGAVGDGGVQVGHVGYGVVDAAEPEAAAGALDGDVFVDQKRDADGRKDGADGGRAEDGVVVAHDGEALRAVDAVEEACAVLHGVHGEAAAERAVGDEVAGEEDEVGLERVDVGDDAGDECGLGVLVEVDVGDLGDAEVAEGVGQVGDGDGAGEDADLVTGDLGGVEAEAGRGDGGAEQEFAPGYERLFLLKERLIGEISGHGL